MSTTVPPPPYEEHNSGQAAVGQAAVDPLLDDFNYSTKVAFCDAPVRRHFTRKVYTVLSTQLLITFTWSLFVSKYRVLQRFVLDHMWLWWTALAVSFVTCLWISLSPRGEDWDAKNEEQEPAWARREQRPWYILTKSRQFALLMVFTFTEAYTLGVVCLTYDSGTVLSALLITTVVVVGVSAVAISGRFQIALESMGSVYYWLNWALWLIIGIGFSSLFFGISGKWDLLYGWLGAIVFTVYLFVDTQLVFRKVYVDEEIKCAMMLYLDIINLFLSILRILSHNDDN
ncbi:Bxi1p KNAG_0K02410 [Huiozyma naganishii CBS 8797]|uniref:Uncharacterized protein n=1 Tax=Huiozyma naganishii (strain ATCC MYA-139 / BCRC 22969 / CBS 8797 / KCTC 17520 / NBRC 10181 / NCYC 3082 / Yp74L-3) TaxID=1071383 RepID=J7SAB1_HUIN7|nr:hypothetical protein KNAG_0K02410 [Kazachstania naganishii CBS 8797]CCK72604.1 hypothetical protein KNAG_0K02410 [Kazachstania naganishii CBS 8797]